MTGRHDGTSINTADLTALLNGVGNRNSKNSAGQRGSDGKTAHRQDGMTAVKSKFTALLTADDALAFDKLAYELRSLTGRRVEKSEVLRALIRLALDDDQTLISLGEALDRRTRPSGT